MEQLSKLYTNLRAIFILTLLMLVSMNAVGENKTYKLKTSGTIDTSKGYLIVYQTSAEATSGTLMSSSFTSATANAGQSAAVGSTVTISSNMIEVDESNDFAFSSTGTDGKYYLQNNEGYYFGNHYTSSTSNEGNWFAVTNTSSPGENYYNTVSFSNNAVIIGGSYNGAQLCYSTSCGGNAGNNGFFYGFQNAIYLYEETSNITCKTAVGGTITSDVSKAITGETVTLTITPETGYELNTLTVTDANSANIETTKQADDTYTFTMPASAVTVSATFVDSTPSYSITCNSSAGGSVTASASAKENATVSLTVTPDDDYKLNTLTVKDASNNEVTVTDNSFTMPASDVTVSATFTCKYDIILDEKNNGAEEYGTSGMNYINAQVYNNSNGNTSRTMYFKRLINVDKWNSLVLPMNITASSLKGAFGNGVELLEFTNCEGNTITFTDVDLTNGTADVINAGKCYLVKPSAINAQTTGTISTELAQVTGTTISVDASEESPVHTFTNVSFTEAVEEDPTYSAQKFQPTTDTGITDNLAFMGTYFDVKNALGYGAYAINSADGDWYRYIGTTKIEVMGFRCWIGQDANSTMTTDNPSKLILVINGQSSDPSGITNTALNQPQVIASGKVFHIDGQFVGTTENISKLPKGIYICNGKKFIVK